jgi:hypothetical protein
MEKEHSIFSPKKREGEIFAVSYPALSAKFVLPKTG